MSRIAFVFPGQGSQSVGMGRALASASPAAAAVFEQAGLTDIEIRPTHRVHDQAASAIVRASKP